MRFVFAVALALSVGAAVAAEPYASASFVSGVKGRATGFFHVECQPDGTWWAIDPLGRGFYFAGVQSVNYQGCCEFKTNRRRYREANDRVFGSVEKWADDTAKRLTGWGFNMLGMWCQRELEHRGGLVYARNIEMGASVCRPDLDTDLWIDAPLSFCQKFPNVFHPGFAAHCAEVAARLVAPWKDDPYLVGWYIDNELSWRAGYDDIRVPSRFGMYERVLRKPAGHSARQALARYLETKGYRIGDKVPDAVKVGFLELAAEKYFKITSEAIRAADPNHMVLGPRFAGVGGAADDCVWRVAGKYCDVVAFNCYPETDIGRNAIWASVARQDEDLPATFRRLYGLTQKPVMITEWSFLALDTGRPCRRGAGQRFRTQAERTKATELCLRHYLALPFVVGWNWFRWVDQPAAGTHSPSGKPGEDSNYGLVNEDGEPYPIADVFAHHLKDVVRWRTEPVPAVSDVQVMPDEHVSVVADAFRRGREGRSVAFSEFGNAYALALGGGVRVCGSKGATNLFFVVEENGRPMMDFGPNLNWQQNGGNRWTAIGRVTDVRWQPTQGGGRLLLRGVSTVKPAYAVTVACEFAAGRRGFVASVEAVKNLSAEPLDVNRVFLHQRAAFEPLKGQPESIAGMKCWKSLRKAAWFADDGRWCGGATRAPMLKSIRYFLAGDGRQHADCAFRVRDGAGLAPGAVRTFDGGAWAVFLFGEGGRKGLVDAFDFGL